MPCHSKRRERLGQRNRRPRAILMGVLGLGLLLRPGTTHAENLKSRWTFGGALSYLSTSDDIRSNAALFVGSPGADGVFGTGDSGETRTCFDAGAYCDPRPDDLLSRETSIEEAIRFDAIAAFGFTDWLSLQVEAGYFKADVGPVDVYQMEKFPALTSTGGVRVSFLEQSTPVVAGKITEIPVSLTAVVRFRKDKSVNPYVGFGAGRIFTEVDPSGELAELNAHLATLKIRDKSNELGESIVTGVPANVREDGRIPLGESIVSIDVDDVFEWHAVGGVEYFFNERTSIVFDARYMFADQDNALTITMGGEDQVNFSILAPELFREDGSVRFYNSLGRAPNTLCREAANPPGFDPMTTPQSEWFGCPFQSDAFSRIICQVGRLGNYDGGTVYPNDPDVCYDPALFSGLVPPSPWGDVVVQGGRIALTGFAASIGLRFHF